MSKEQKETLKSVAGKVKNAGLAATAVVGMYVSTPNDNVADKYAKETYRAGIVERDRRNEVDSASKASSEGRSK